jgi:hypothetical protein
MERSKNLRDENRGIKNTFGLNRDEVNCKCASGHELSNMRRMTGQNCDVNPSCAKCNQGLLADAKFYYGCIPCEYYMCRICALQTSSPPVLKYKMKFWWHNHVMKKVTNCTTGWDCDSRRNDLTDKHCFSGTTGFYQTKFIQNYKC